MRSIKVNYTEIDEDNVTVYGNYNHIRGNNCFIIGNYNHIYGSQCGVNGNYNQNHGTGNTVHTGNYNQGFYLKSNYPPSDSTYTTVTNGGGVAIGVIGGGNIRVGSLNVCGDSNTVSGGSVISTVSGVSTVNSVNRTNSEAGKNLRNQQKTDQSDSVRNDSVRNTSDISRTEFTSHNEMQLSEDMRVKLSELRNSNLKDGEVTYREQVNKAFETIEKQSIKDKEAVVALLYEKHKGQLNKVETQALSLLEEARKMSKVNADSAKSTEDQNKALLAAVQALLEERQTNNSSSDNKNVKVVE